MTLFNKIMVFALLVSAGIHAELPHIDTDLSPLQCDWSKINVNDVKFENKNLPKPGWTKFGWGAATSAFQIEGTVTANGKHIQNTWTVLDRAQNIGKACDHWERYKEDVQLIKDLGLNEYRFSIKWSAVMPEEGKFDADAMAHYVDLTRKLIDNGITPYVMLFHHAWPVWFDAKSAFEKKENIRDFVRFALYVFDSLYLDLTPEQFNKIKWMTFNEPTGYCLEAYYRGKYPPFKKRWFRPRSHGAQEYFGCSY